MRKKECKLVVTFRTTTDAMAMEAACKKMGVPGRLIPVPRVITASCGLAWCAELSHREVIKEALRQIGIAEEAIQECLV